MYVYLFLSTMGIQTIKIKLTNIDGWQYMKIKTYPD